MYAIASDLKSLLTSLVDGGTSPLVLVVVEEHPDYPGELVFQVVEGEGAFYARYKQWISCYLTLNELYNLQSFVDQLTKDGWEVVFGPSTEKTLGDMMRWRLPLKIEGYDLHPFQQFSLNRAFEQDFFFFNWATGTGKSAVVAPAGGKELFRRDEVDVVVAATLSKSKENLRRAFERAGLDAVVNDGAKSKRSKGYAAGHQVYVLNYEKFNFDKPELADLVRGKRVLWIFDETQKLITDDKKNKARTGFEFLLGCAQHNRVWPMSASVVNGNPLRYRDVFNLNGNPRANPLGTRRSFEDRYADEVKTIPLETANGKTYGLTVYDWNLTRLQEIRHRAGGRTQAVRKTDPGVREHFRGLQTITVPIQPSPEEVKLTDFIIDRAYDAYCLGQTLAPYYLALRTVANTPSALLRTQSAIVGELFNDSQYGLGSLVINADRKPSKIDVLNEQLESIREAGDKVLVFTHYTTLTLDLIKDLIQVPHVIHYGAQNDKESQEAQDEFQNNSDITCFLTSDAGAHGLNMQVARYVIQYEPTYSYDDGMQRASRIDRSDSHLDGLTNFVYITEDSVEERVWQINNARRAISAAVQGTEEAFSHGDVDREMALRSEAENLGWMIFGNRI